MTEQTQNKFGAIQDDLFQTIAEVKQEFSDGSKTGTPTRLIAAMRAAASVKIHVVAQQFPVGIDKDDITAVIDERIFKMTQSIDFNMDTKQIMQWFYKNLSFAIKDAQRQSDTLPRRMRELVNATQARVKVIERQLGRELSDQEVRQAALQILGPQQSKQQDVEQLITFITTGIKYEDSTNIEALPDDSDLESEMITRERNQALHIAGLDIEDDRLFEAFSALANDGTQPPKNIRKKLEVLLQQRLIKWRSNSDTEPPPPTVPMVESDLVAMQQAFALDDNRPLRFLFFAVNNWTPQHELRVDSIAETRLGMSIVIRQRSKGAEIYIAEPPGEMWGLRRWRLLVAILYEPNFRDSDWPRFAEQIKDSLPFGVRMRVITKEIFDQQAAASKRRAEREEGPSSATS